MAIELALGLDLIELKGTLLSAILVPTVALLVHLSGCGCRLAG